MKKLLLLILLSTFVFALSGCSSPKQDIFYKNVKCYELSGPFVDKLNNEFQGEGYPLNVSFVFYSLKANTCFIEVSRIEADGDSHLVSFIYDLLRNEQLASSYSDGRPDLYNVLKSKIEAEKEEAMKGYN